VDSALLEMKGIEIQFPGVKALDKVDFTLRAGEGHALLGENGAGKSTLIKCLTGVHRMDAGTIQLEGRKIHPASPWRRRSWASCSSPIFWTRCSRCPTA